MIKNPFTTFPLSDEAKTHLMNIAQNNSSGLIGVRKEKNSNKWRAVIQHQGVNIDLGLFDNKYDAALARDNKALELYGDNAVTNFALGLVPTQNIHCIPGSMEKTAEMINARLPIHLKYYGRLLFGLIVLAKHDGTTISNIIKNNPDINSLSKKDRTKIVLILEELNLIKIIRQGEMRIDKCKLFLKTCIEEEQSIKQLKEPIKKLGVEMSNSNDLMSKSPEELEALAKQIKALSDAKKEEIRNGDNIRKTINPLILQVCQAKGKVSRLLEQQIDAIDELEKAINNLKDALK